MCCDNVDTPLSFNDLAEELLVTSLAPIAVYSGVRFTVTCETFFGRGAKVLSGTTVGWHSISSIQVASTCLDPTTSKPIVTDIQVVTSPGTSTGPTCPSGQQSRQLRLRLSASADPQGRRHSPRIVRRGSPRVARPADVTVMRSELAVAVPAIAAGQRTVQFDNIGAQAHEMMLLKVVDDVTPEQAQQALEVGNVGMPFHTQSAGGLAAIPPSTSGWATVDFTPGLWMMVCYVADAASDQPEAVGGVPHATLGMVHAFRVQQRSVQDGRGRVAPAPR